MTSRIRISIVLTAVFLGACTLAIEPGSPRSPASSPPTHADGTPATGASPAGIAAVPSPSPLACRLPVASGDAPMDGNRSHGVGGHGGFVQMPSGSFSPDPASLGTYDHALSRWLPVFRAWVAPDGLRYAYPEYRGLGASATGQIHVVDAASGADRVLALPVAVMPISFETEGIYVARVLPNSGAPPWGVARLDPASGVLQQVVGDGIWTHVWRGFAYGADVDAAIAPPVPSGPGAANRVRRLDLTTGSTSVVALYPGSSVQILGLSADGPILAVATAGTYAVSVGSTRLFSGPVAADNPAGPIATDGTRIWFSSQSGAVWLSQRDEPAHRISDTPLQLAQVAGSCR